MLIDVDESQLVLVDFQPRLQVAMHPLLKLNEFVFV